MNAKQFFLNKFFGCYPKKIDKYPNSIFYIFNPQIIRQKKLCRVTGEELNLDLIDERKSVCLFFQNNESFCINYDEIWSILYVKFGYTFDCIKELISDWLNEDLKIGQYKIHNSYLNGWNYKLKIGEFVK